MRSLTSSARTAARAGRQALHAVAGRVIDGGLWATGRGCTYDVEEEYLGGADLLLAVALWQQAAGGHGRAHLIWALARLLLLIHVLAQVPALVLLQLWQRGQAIGQELCQRGRAVGRRTLAAAAPIVGNGCLGMQLSLRKTGWTWQPTDGQQQPLMKRSRYD